MTGQHSQVDKRKHASYSASNTDPMTQGWPWAKKKKTTRLQGKCLFNSKITVFYSWDSDFNTWMYIIYLQIVYIINSKNIANYSHVYYSHYQKCIITLSSFAIHTYNYHLYIKL